MDEGCDVFCELKAELQKFDYKGINGKKLKGILLISEKEDGEGLTCGIFADKLTNKLVECIDDILKAMKKAMEVENV